MKPRRIQRKRTKGWKMPPNTVYVGRPSDWGNPYRVGISTYDHLGNLVLPLSVDSCIELYEKDVKWRVKTAAMHRHEYPLDELRGKNLACWCALDAPCHADVLLRLANE